MNDTEETYHPLDFTQAILEDEGYSTEMLTKAGGAAADVLLVVLQGTGDERFVLEILYVDDVLETLGFEEDLETSVMLQFLVRLPHCFVPERAPELALLCGELSRIIPAGMLGLSHRNGVLYFRYCLHLPAKSVDRRVLMTIVMSTEIFLGMFSPLIKQVGDGQESAENVLSSLEGDGFVIPGISSLDTLPVRA